MSHPDTLRRLPLFSNWRAADVDHAAALLTTVHVPAGQTLIHQGDRSRQLLILAEGSAEVHRQEGGSTVSLGVVEAGSPAGELSILYDIPATASVVAAEPVVVLGCDAGQVRRLLSLGDCGPRIRAIANRRAASNRARAVAPVVVRLRDGRRVAIRPLWSDDWRRMADGRDRVSQRSLLQRFFVVPPLTDEALARLADIDFTRDFAWAALALGGGDTNDDGDGDQPLVAVARYSRDAEDPGLAELAMIVADDHQGQGLGHVLLDALAAAAIEHEVLRFRAVVQHDNLAARNLLAPTGARFSRSEQLSVLTTTFDVPEPPGDGERAELHRAMRAAALESTLGLGHALAS
jgi:protein lysine acetyltransferase